MKHNRKSTKKLYICGACENGVIKGATVRFVCPHCNGTSQRELSTKQASQLNLREVKK